ARKAGLHVATKNPPKNSPAFNLLDHVPDNQKAHARNVKASLGYTPHESRKYLEYSQKAIFGFSVGQRISLKSLQEYGLTAEELETMLEGSDQVTNMFHLAMSLENQIAEAKKQKKDPQYIQKLEKMHGNLMRSLPLALEASAVD